MFSHPIDHFVQLDSRILAVNSGAELGQYAMELVEHFRTQGSPIMIGIVLFLLVFLGNLFVCHVAIFHVRFLRLPRFSDNQRFNAILVPYYPLL